MYTAREVAAVLGLSSARLRSYLRAGFVAPHKGEDGELRFSFQDLVLLRKAEGLVTGRIAPRRVHNVMRKLREKLPDGASLTGVQLAAHGREIVADDGLVRWTPDSGQVVFDFDRRPRPEAAPITPLIPLRPPVAPANDSAGELTAQQLYERGCQLEEPAPGEARELYRRAVAADPSLADAHVNLGRLLHEAGQVTEALTHYRKAFAIRPQDATAAFNIVVALEDLGMAEEAIAAYSKAIGCDAKSADAHYNLARLLEQSGKPEVAIRHLLIYRQLTRKK
jgi:tetratricopeptide (TPR) repeat protein